MTLNEIRESGLLELYVLGELSENDEKEVVDALQEFPELSKDLEQISKALTMYAQANAIKAPSGLYKSIENQINDSGSNGGSSSTSGPWLWILSVLALAFLAYGIYQNLLKNQLAEENQRILVDCEEDNDELLQELEFYQEIHNKENTIYAVAATDKYPETKLYLHQNDNTNRNFLQIQNLPAITADQSYQLWSLKADQDPIPLDVFNPDQEAFIEVESVDNTNTYAITIEPRGGRQTPTLENLIGTFAISG